MTEEEAKKKACPLNSISAYINAGLMAKNGVPEQMLVNQINKSRCVASDCMMWNTRLVRIENAVGELIDMETHGYCGLGSNNGN